MRKTSFLACLAALLLLGPSLFAQTPPAGDEPVQMADALHANGKIYVVVAVVIAIVAGMLFYLVRLDRKITRLEKEG